MQFGMEGPFSAGHDGPTQIQARADKGNVMALKIGKKRRPTQERSINQYLELFEGLSDTELTDIGKFFTIIDVKEGRDLGRRGTQCQYFGVVLKGQVVMSFHDTPVGFLTPGTFWGATALLDPGPDKRRRGSAHAIVDSRIAIASPSEFSGLLHACPLVAQRIQSVVDRRTEYVAREGQSDLDKTAEPLTYQVHIPVDA